MLMIELPTATPPLAMTAAYKETDVTIRIRPNRYYSAEYRIAVHPTIRPRSEYEANIRYSPTDKHQVTHWGITYHWTCNACWDVNMSSKDAKFGQVSLISISLNSFLIMKTSCNVCI